MLTLDDAKNLHYRQTIYHVSYRNSDKSPLRARVNGKAKLWKTQPNRIQVPMKYGLYDCFYLTKQNLNQWCLTEAEALAQGKDNTTHE